MPELFTLGYEGLSQDRFIKILISRHIEKLIDVRAIPMSRKRGFSKSSLQTACDEANLEYHSWIELGCPRDILTTYRNDKDWSAYTRKFKAHLTTIQSEIESLAAQAQTCRICLMCFEADPDFCHRTYIAEAARQTLSETYLDIIHLNQKGLAVVS